MIPLRGHDTTAADRAIRALGEIRGLLLGFDSLDETPETALAQYLSD